MCEAKMMDSGSQADYEKTYKSFQLAPQPRVTDVHYDIAMYPETREFVMRGAEQIKNETAAPIDLIYLTVDRNFTSSIQLPGAQLAQNDKRLGYQRFKLTTPLAPGKSVTLSFDVESHPQRI